MPCIEKIQVQFNMQIFESFNFLIYHYYDLEKVYVVKRKLVFLFLQMNQFCKKKKKKAEMDDLISKHDVLKQPQNVYLSY